MCEKRVAVNTEKNVVPPVADARHHGCGADKGQSNRTRLRALAAAAQQKPAQEDMLTNEDLEMSPAKKRTMYRNVCTLMCIS